MNTGEDTFSIHISTYIIRGTPVRTIDCLSIAYLIGSLPLEVVAIHTTGVWERQKTNRELVIS